MGDSNAVYEEMKVMMLKFCVLLLHIAVLIGEKCLQYALQLSIGVHLCPQ